MGAKSYIPHPPGRWVQSLAWPIASSTGAIGEGFLVFTAGFDFLLSGGEEFASSPDRIPLNIIARQEFKAVPQAIAIAHQSAQLQRRYTGRQRELKRRHLAGLELSG